MITSTIPRPEHPKPQFERGSWLNLNGQWEFEIDNGRSGIARGLSSPDAKLSGSITVPFCPESALSGVGHKDFMYGVWYRREIVLTEEQCAGRCFLHFGAVDYEAQVWVNGTKIGSHKGGYISFALEATEAVRPGTNVITVYAEDDNRDPMIPRGKQCEHYFSCGCDYTRTTGIWQTVWLEFTPKNYMKYVRFDPNPDANTLTITAELEGSGSFTAEVSYEGTPVGTLSFDAMGGTQVRTLSLEGEVRLWEPGIGRLYDVTLRYADDTVHSYFGMRSIRMDDNRFYLNGKSVFQRLILDQGFYPDGVYTAPSDEALARDIDMSMAMGFNGARLHEKIFEERFLYHADRKGYLVWGEFPNWGLDHSMPESIFGILPEWLQELKRDYNHPSIIGWCPFNETWDMNHRKQYDDVILTVYRATKAVDTSRPCIDTSGNFHTETDIYDVHDYEQDPAVFKAHYDELAVSGELFEQVNHGDCRGRQHYVSGPVMMSEYGGIRWCADMDEQDRTVSWGYGKDVADYDELKARFKGLTDALLDNPRMMGLCYTQLTDVEQEQNGLYTFARKAKFDPDWVRSVMGRKAAVED